MPDGSRIYQRPASLLQQLIRFNTTNPPGNEAACISYIRDLLAEVEVPTMLLARNPARPNLIARLPGQGRARPLLLEGHIDVVTTEHQVWQHPPFEGKEVDGYIWGRGALDMKGGVAMMLAAFLRAKAEGVALPGDVVLAVLCDEEAFSNDGAKYLVEQHPEVFQGIRYALGEFGGFSLYIGGRKFYPIGVAEKQVCWMKATVRGPAGHGSIPMRSGAMAKLGNLLHQVDAHRLPVHITPVARQMFEAMISAFPPSLSSVFSQLLDPARTDQVLDGMGTQGLIIDPLLHNTVNATIVHGGDKINVIPSEIVVELDGRLLPGYHPADMITELRSILSDEVELELLRHDPGPPEPDMGLFETLADILREAEPDGIPIPFLLSGVSDARFFSRLGIQIYGFIPMQLPEAFNFVQTIHAADERIPVEALEFGTNAIYTVLQRFDNSAPSSSLKPPTA
jgi:acetylornithine deacetylase/succinyl-diaminopimelate desuccinylase-like protein